MSHKTIFVIIVTFFFRCAKHGRTARKNENSTADVRVSFETFHTMLAPLRETRNHCEALV
jgi:hypothetical protein